MKKKAVLSIGILMLMSVFPTGCGHKHVWEDAACIVPKTCSGCGETEGEALGHTWADATCIAPKTCSVCGETAGNALEHTLSEANYQQAAACEVCGAIVGEPLQADFEKYNLTKHMVELDQEYDYKTLCYKNSVYTTVGKVIFSNYRTFDSDETHEAKEGYEWKTVDYTLSFGDDNAWEYGISPGFCFENYYDIIKSDDTLATDDNGIEHFTVNWNGVDYTECCRMFDVSGWSDWTDNTDPAYEDWEHIVVYKESCAVLVPIGYDGIVVGERNRAVEWGEGQYVFDIDNTDTLFFRMK